MKIAHLNPAYHGGAGEAARRLHAGLLRRGIDSTFFNFQEEIPEEKTALIRSSRSLFSRLGSKWRAVSIECERARIRRQLDPLCDSFSDDRTSLAPDLGESLTGYDLIHIHGTSYLIDYRRSLRAFARRGQRVVWTLHDMNAFTGGCHYDRDCGRFRQECGACPALRSSSPADLSRRIWGRKNEGLAQLDPARVHFVCPSLWLTRTAGESSLLGRFSISRIANAVDADRFHPADQREARHRLGLPPESRIVLFVASSLDLERKGFHLLQEALERLASLPGLFLAAVGATRQTHALKVPHRLFGSVSDPSLLRDIYNAADVTVVPSLQEAFGNILIESMACAVPVVGFARDGMTDILRDGESGLSVPSGDSAALGEAIEAILRDKPRRLEMGRKGRLQVEREYTLEINSAAYLHIYDQLLAKP